MSKTVRESCEQMNSDMFDKSNHLNYDVSNFSELQISQAKESFKYNGYKTFAKDGKMTAKL